jgi:hypothetical protein
MRFRTRFEQRWMENLVRFSALAGVVFAGINFLLLDSHPAHRWPVDLELVCWLILIACSSPRYCEVREEDLLLRQGWTRKSLIPYASLVELRARADAYGVLAIANDGKRFAISLGDAPRFLREAYRRCPRLNPATDSPSFALI